MSGCRLNEMPAASPYRVRERRVAVMMGEAEALPVETTPSSDVDRSLFMSLAPALAIVCAVCVFLALSRREQVFPHAAVRAAVVTPAPPVSKPLPAPPQPQVETIAIHLGRSRSFTDASGFGWRLSLTNVRRQLCDLDVKPAHGGYRRVRLHLGQTAVVNDGADKLTIRVDSIARRDVKGSVQRISYN